MSARNGKRGQDDAAMGKDAHAVALRPAAQIVPQRSVAGNALTLVVAIMSFLACLTMGGVTLISDAARAWQSDVGREVTIQIRPIDGVDIEAELEKARQIAEMTAGVAAARIVSVAETERLLEPWLGKGLDLSGLPLPRLVVVELTDAGRIDFEALRGRLRKEVAGASLDDHGLWTERLAATARILVLIGLGVLALVLVAMVLSVVFATRGAMTGNRAIVEVLHFVGAEDGFIAAQFQRHFMILGLKGGLAGGIAAMSVFALGNLVFGNMPGSASATEVDALFGGFAIGWNGYLGALAIVFLVAILTAATSRLTVQRHLASLD